MIVFSFSLYGSAPKYTRGMICNAQQLAISFPAARVNVYIASDVPSDIYDILAAMPNVHLISVPRRPGSAGMFDRYRAIDEPDCDVMFVRDADSRVHARDIACIEDFLATPDKLLHIIRDHKYHTCKIMGGTIGMRKAAIGRKSMSERISTWINRDQYMMDQHFLVSEFYEALKPVALIHDRFGRYDSTEKLTTFRVPIYDNLFVGQVHDYREDGSEYTQFLAD